MPPPSTATSQLRLPASVGYPAGSAVANHKDPSAEVVTLRPLYPNHVYFHQVDANLPSEPSSPPHIGRELAKEPGGDEGRPDARPRGRVRGRPFEGLVVVTRPSGNLSTLSQTVC